MVYAKRPVCAASLDTSYLVIFTLVLACRLADAIGGNIKGSASIYNNCQQLRKSNEFVHGCVVKDSDGHWAMANEDSQASLACVASGTFVDSSYTTSNFGKLRVVTGVGYSDVEQAFAAGFLEGYLTAARIYDHHSNLKSYFVTMLNESASLEAALDWLETQEKWANKQVRIRTDDPYWQLLGLIQAQFDGLVAGYQTRAKEEPGQQRQEQQRQGRRGQQRRLFRTGGRRAGRRLASGGEEDVEVGWLTRRDMLFLNSNGDVYDIIDAMEAGYGSSSNRDGVLAAAGQQAGSWMGRGGVPRRAEVDPDPVRMALKLGLQGKCSALIKVTGDLGDLLLGHSTHDSYTAMTRIYKHYDFTAAANPGLVAKRMSFSSYPGELFSDDDFYLLSTGLAVLETTNHIYVGDVFAALQPECVLSWQRLRLANWMGGSGEEWVELFGRYNSGTYNNQYMIINTRRFIPHTELQPGLLWVVEQLPGMYKSADMTDELSRGYWPSYNVAYFPEVYEAAGYPNMIERLAAQGAKKYAFSIRLLRYQIAPRAAIFRRDQGAVDSVEAIKSMMRYNDWQHDPYADGHPVGAVCARGDLAKGDEAIAKGCYDSKVTSASMVARLESEVVAGPTAQGQSPFSWSDPRWSDLPHRGMPDTFDFQFERMSPADLPTARECEAAAAAVATATEEEEAAIVAGTALVTAGQQEQGLGMVAEGDMEEQEEEGQELTGGRVESGGGLRVSVLRAAGLGSSTDNEV